MPQAQDLLEKLAEILLYNFHREHIWLILKIKKLLRKIKSKNLTAGVYEIFTAVKIVINSYKRRVYVRKTFRKQTVNI